MNIFIKLFNIIIIFYINIEYSYSYIIYPFKTRKTQINHIENNITLLFRSIVDNNIFINLEIGEPKQIIEVFLRLDSDILYFSEKNKSDLNPNYTNPQIYDVQSDINKFFDKNKSLSFEITNKIAEVYSDKGNYSSDFFYFKTDKKNSNSKLRLSFALLEHTRGNMPGVLGLRLLKYEDNKSYNLIEQLKYNDIINSYFWMINYTSEFEGNLIIGEQPHIFDSIHYKEENLKITYPFLNKGMLEWGLKFDEIIFNNENFRPYHESYFKYERNYIKGPPNFEKKLDKYFNESIQNGTCFKEYIKYTYAPHIFYYCDKEKYKNNLIYFPNITFEHKELNYTFELNYKDLFIEKYDKLILMIFFDEIGTDWHLGIQFLRKYSFLINPDLKTVGFYTKIENGKKDNKNGKNDSSGKNLVKIIIIIILIGILLIIGIFIGKYFFSKNRKPINTINDDYEYKSKNDDFIDKNEKGKIN